MPQLKSKRPAKAKPKDATAALRAALAKQTKDQLVDLVLELAGADRQVLRRLTGQLEVAVPPKELVSATRRAIVDATAFDPREVNHNFDYDYEAYEEVKRNLAHLVELGQLRTAMELALVLMKDGSHQVEMSDEGMMTQDIEECLRVVIQAVERCDLPRKDVIAWHAKMRQNDRVGFVAEKDLRALQDRFEASGPP